MQHVTTILLSYMMYEVLETGWLSLQESLEKSTSLDDLIRAHENYQSDILSAALLDQNTEGKKSSFCPILCTLDTYYYYFGRLLFLYI
jgi:hypothetical protein